MKDARVHVTRVQLLDPVAVLQAYSVLPAEPSLRSCWEEGKRRDIQAGTGEPRSALYTHASSACNATV
jgi:hypothetical protein